MSHNGEAPETPPPGRGSPGGNGEVVAHIRPSRLRSIRIRIVLPVLLASAGLLTLGVVQSREALDEAAAGERARVLADTSAAAVALVHLIELEYSENNLLRQRGGQAGVQLLTAAQARTDVARARFDRSAPESRAVAPDIGPALDNLGKAFALLPAMREIAPGDAEAPPQVFDAYEEIIHETIAVADAVANQLADARLTEIARSVVLAAELKHLAAKQLDLLRRIFNRGSVGPGELVRLAHWEGAENQQLEEIERLTGPSAVRFQELVSGDDVKRATELRDAVLAADGAPDSIQVDPDVWYAAQSGLLRRLRLLEIELSANMERTAFDIQATAQRRAAVIGGATVAVVVAVLLGAGLLAVRTSRRLRRVRDAALTVARAELPNAINRVTASDNVDDIRGTLQDSSGRIEGMLAPGSDEIGELTVAFGAVHRQALRLAADQALLRMEVEATFAALSRRGQTLVQRQIHLIDEFGRSEHDPGRLGRLFALDHLAGRMRRNEENLLVLAGGEPGRRFTAPVPVLDVIQAAAEEIEDYSRVEIAVAPPVAILAHAVGDTVHLLAELLENATSFSPPTTKVRVAARQTVEHLTITVFDEGIGLPPAKLAEANERLARPSALTSTLVGTMGLLVVARLARRHGIEVQLSSTPGGGTAATVVLPEPVLASALADDQLRRNRLRGASPTIDQVSYQVIPASDPRTAEAHPVQPLPVTVPAARTHAEYVVPAERPAVVVAGQSTPVRYLAPVDYDVRPGYLEPRYVDAGFVEVGQVEPAGVGGSFLGVPAHPTAPPRPAFPRSAGPQALYPATAGPQPIYPVAVDAEQFGAPQGAVAGYTATGLPRRRAGGALPVPPGPPGRQAFAAPASGSHAAGAAPAAVSPAGTPDPDTVRARLSSLASGIAAANRRVPAPPSS